MPQDILYPAGNNIGTFTDTDGLTGTAAALSTGDLRRKYNFGSRVSELSLSQDPFFRFVSKVGKKATDDPQFKFTERRGSFHKRYAYVGLYDEGGDATPATATSTPLVAAVSENDKISFRMGTDYSSTGNRNNILGQTTAFEIGAADTQPIFFLPEQVIRIPMASASLPAGGVTDGYMVAKIDSVDLSTPGYADLVCTVVSGAALGDSIVGAHATIDAGSGAASDITVSEQAKAANRCYVMGTVFGKGTGIPQTWHDQPWVTGHGQTQIFKTAMAMTNTDRATSLKYEGNEWARIWKEKLVEHKWDIEQSLLFGSMSTDNRTTQGAVDYILAQGNIFQLDITSKTVDDFLNDLSAYFDPRYNNAGPTIFFCNTAVYNWLHQLGGYFANNLGIGDQFRADLAVTGRKKVLGLDATTISTPYGDMKLVRNIHLDGTHIQLLGVNMKHCNYRPLVGNGLNRDTSVYVGVQTLENTGVDRRVDMILTEAGMQWEMPEAHACWVYAPPA